MEPGLFSRLIKADQLLVYEHMRAIFVYRQTCCTYQEGRAIECIFASVPSDQDLGCFYAPTVAASRDGRADVVLLEATGDNSRIAKQLSDDGIRFLFQAPTSFFLYNHSARKVEARDCGLLY